MNHEKLASRVAVNLNCRNLLLQDDNAFVDVVRLFKTALRLAADGASDEEISRVLGADAEVDDVSERFWTEFELERGPDGLVRPKRTAPR